MKFCTECGAQLDDNTIFCTQCGTNLNVGTTAAPAEEVVQAEEKPAPKYDHTDEMDADDIHENKVIALSVYALGIIGIIIAALAGKKSKFVQYHLRQGLRFLIVEIILVVIMAATFWTIVGFIGAIVGLCILAVLIVISFIQTCMGKAIEPAIIRNFGFLK